VPDLGESAAGLGGTPSVRNCRTRSTASAQEQNWALPLYLKPQYRELFTPWEQKAADMVACLRMNDGCRPDDPACPPPSGNSPSRARSSDVCGRLTTSRRRATASNSSGPPGRRPDPELRVGHPRRRHGTAPGHPPAEPGPHCAEALRLLVSLRDGRDPGGQGPGSPSGAISTTGGRPTATASASRFAMRHMATTQALASYRCLRRHGRRHPRRPRPLARFHRLHRDRLCDEGHRLRLRRRPGQDLPPPPRP
jgi:hypothetical protein